MTRLQHSFCVVTLLIAGVVQTAGCANMANSGDSELVMSTPGTQASVPSGTLNINVGGPDYVSR